MKNSDEISRLTRKLIQPGFVFESSKAGLVPLRINRVISNEKAVDLLPALRNIYELANRGESKKVANRISELTGLLIAADLGIAEEYLIELEVRNVMPKLVRKINKELQKSANSETGEDKQH
jgi:replication initiation and membrane attachment protein DnaB